MQERLNQTCFTAPVGPNDEVEWRQLNRCTPERFEIPKADRRDHTGNLSSA